LTTAVKLLVTQNKTYRGIVEETFEFTFPNRPKTETRIGRHARKVRDILKGCAPDLLPAQSGEVLKPLLSKVRR
jgi:hypothetical protein